MPSYERSDAALAGARDADVLSAFLRGVYGWMCGGLAVTAATAWFVAGGMFGALALYGTLTRRNLGALGQFFFMGLIGLLLASFVGVFWHSDGLQFMISFVGVLVFAGLTMYDAQRLKAMAFATGGGS